MKEGFTLISDYIYGPDFAVFDEDGYIQIYETKKEAEEWQHGDLYIAKTREDKNGIVTAEKLRGGSICRKSANFNIEA